MSDIIEKTIASLPGIIAGAAGLTGDKPITVSRAFQSFVNALGAIHSKYVSHSRIFQAIYHLIHQFSQISLIYQ